VPTTPAFLLEVLALALGGFTGWLGGELVDRLGVGVDDGAHLNAPNSITNRDADEGGRRAPGPPLRAAR
jgi:hypothetical protein